MTKEARDIARAFVAGEVCRRKRTYTDGNRIVLHGSTIAWREGVNVYACLCGWGTVITRDRLNALCRALDAPRFHQHRHRQYFDNAPIGVDDTVMLTKPGPLTEAMIELGIVKI